MAKKVYAKLEVEFRSKKRERCCKLDIHGPEANFWEDLESKSVESIRDTLDRRVQFYEEEIRKLTQQRFTPIWNFCNFFILRNTEQLRLEAGKIQLPDWASNLTSTLWIPIQANSDELATGSSFDKCNDGTLLLQVTLQSQVNAALTIYDAWLDPQDGFSRVINVDGRPTLGFFPLIISPSTQTGILFRIIIEKFVDEAKILLPKSILNVKYGISGDRTIGAHPPVAVDPAATMDSERQGLIFRSSIALQRPVLDPFMAISFLPLPDSSLKGFGRNRHLAKQE